MRTGGPSGFARSAASGGPTPSRGRPSRRRRPFCVGGVFVAKVFCVVVYEGRVVFATRGLFWGSKTGNCGKVFGVVVRAGLGWGFCFWVLGGCFETTVCVGSPWRPTTASSKRETMQPTNANAVLRGWGWPSRRPRPAARGGTGP